MNSGRQALDTGETKPSPAWILAGLTLVALVLRFWRLGDWNFEATEMFTLRDSVRPQFHNPRPLGYLLNYFLVRPVLPLNEFGLRLFPAVFGVLAVPVFYAVHRRLIGTRAALFGALLVSLSAQQVYYAQFARYWSLVFLLCIAYPYLLYLGVRDRNAGALVTGCVTMILAVLAHPVSVLLLGGPALWLVAVYARPRYLRRAWSYPLFRWGTVIALLVAVALLVRLVPLLQNWVSMHDRNPGMGQFLLATKRANGPKQVVLLLAYLQSLSFPVALAAAAGLYVLWRERDRNLAIFLTSLALFCLAFISLVSTRTPVSTFYLLPAAPVLYAGAGVFVDRLFRMDWRLRPGWLVPTTILAMLLIADMPTLVSQYRNGRRFDFRSVAEWLQLELAPGDVVYSDQPMVLAHYLDDVPVQKLRADTEPLTRALDGVRREAARGSLWIVAPAPTHAFRATLKEGGLAWWMYEHCQLRNTVGTGRLDFRQQYLQVFRCPTAPLPEELRAARSEPG